MAFSLCSHIYMLILSTRTMEVDFFLPHCDFFGGNYYMIARLLISNLGCHISAATIFGLAYVIMDLVGCK